MQTKLTLRLDDALINEVKKQAKKSGKSVSQLVAEYFQLLSTKSVEAEQKLPPLTQALRGALKGSKLDEKDYRKYLEKKYQ